MKTTTKTNKLCLFLSMVAFSIILLAKPMTAQAALAAPTNIAQKDASTTQVLITWDIVSGANGYDLRYSTDRTNWSTQNLQFSGTNTVIISGLTAGTTYYVQVATKDSSGEAGTFSQIIECNTAPAMTNANIPKVTNANAQSCTIAWTAVPNATGYYIDYGTGEEFANSKPYGQGFTTATSITLDLPANSGYYVFVTPYRTSANSSFKAEYSYGKTYAATTPSAPKNLYVYDIENKSKKFTFDFTLTSQATNTDGYQVEVYSNKNKKLKTINTTTPLYKPSAQNSKFANTPIKYRVRAYVTLSGKKYYGAWSGYAYYAPSAVTGKLKTTSYTTAKLTWKKVDGAKSYTIYYSTTGEAGSWKVAKKNVKGTSASVKYSRYSKNCYYVQANSISFKGKKGKVSSPNPNKGKDNYMYYSY